MVLQSRAVTVLLTRPQAQSQRFAGALHDRMPQLNILISPLMRLDFVRPVLPDRPWTAMIFTSETAVHAAKRIAAEHSTLPRTAFCVGDQTARAAQAQGFTAISAQGDGEALISLILSSGIAGPLLYLHGAEVRVDVAKRLLAAKIDTHSAVSYAQTPCHLTTAAVTLLGGKTPVIAPIFSPNTGESLARELARIGATAPLSVVAISHAAAEAFANCPVIVAARPDASAMLDAIMSRLT